MSIAPHTENFFEHCPLCTSTELVILKAYSSNHLAQCNNCSFVFARKIPSIEELIAHYNTYPRGNKISAITIKRYHELLDKLEPYRKTNNLIDVGCGDGFFLETARERKWNVYGTEYTDEAIKICSAKGINMQQGKLNPEHYPADFFDVITSFEVLEHINNPQEELRNFHRILRSGGAVYVTTPNFNSASRYYLKNKWNIIEYPEHLGYFTQRTLTKLFHSSNFKTIHFESSGISFSRFTKSISNTAKADTSILYQDESLREKTETNFVFKLAKISINFTLNLFNAGDTLKGTFEKK
ncbi:MAG: class I SAM-dependent methyltransferase [Bacteroidetes bacterium]|nr:class I SAM-dependent methyltransferase [Bacteroidota bacterium]